ncbi:Hypothetical protein HVR_LOCUS989 [uncultured virus]|nr:Hypothetical protein HVR_LOCUS989 [uncultured virus]
MSLSSNASLEDLIEFTFVITIGDLIDESLAKVANLRELLAAGKNGLDKMIEYEEYEDSEGPAIMELLYGKMILFTKIYRISGIKISLPVQMLLPSLESLLRIQECMKN